MILQNHAIQSSTVPLPPIATLDVLVTSTETDQTTPGSIVLQVWDLTASKRRALAAFAVIYFFGFLSLANIFMHFFLILPPLWIVIGPYAAMKIFRHHFGSFSLRDGRAACPACGQPTRLHNQGPTLPFHTYCDHCRCPLLATAADETALPLAEGRLRQEHIDGRREPWFVRWAAVIFRRKTFKVFLYFTGAWLLLVLTAVCYWLLSK